MVRMSQTHSCSQGTGQSTCTGHASNQRSRTSYALGDFSTTLGLLPRHCFPLIQAQEQVVYSSLDSDPHVDRQAAHSATLGNLTGLDY